MNKRKTSIRAGAAVLGTAAVAGVAWIAIPAEAATTGVVSVVSSNIVTYTAATGKANTVVVTRSANTITVDDVYGIKAGAGCRAVSGDTTKITCALSVAPAWIRVDLQDGNDKLYNNSGLGMTAWGRAGNDQINGGPGRDDVYAGDGNDSVWGNGGNDLLRGENGADALSGGDGIEVIAGGAGNDRLLGGAGDDVLQGGAGSDIEDGGLGSDEFDEPTAYASGTDRDQFIGGPDATGEDIDAVDYYGRTKAVSADADGVAGDDGQAGEGDSISSSIEAIRGGSAGDKLIGTAREDILFGGAGNDAIAAGAGDDILVGEAGKDLLNGASGDLDYCPDGEPGETVLSCELTGDELSAASAKVKAKVGRELPW